MKTALLCEFTHLVRRVQLPIKGVCSLTITVHQVHGQAISGHILALCYRYTLFVERSRPLVLFKETAMIDVENEPSSWPEFLTDLIENIVVGRLVEVAEALPEIEDGIKRPGKLGEATHVLLDVCHLSSRYLPGFGQRSTMEVHAEHPVALCGQQTRMPAAPTAEIDDRGVGRPGQVPRNKGNFMLSLGEWDRLEKECIPGC